MRTLVGMGLRTGGPGGPGADRWRLFAAAIAGLEGAALIGNAVAVAVVVLRDGITGPSTVASPVGVVVEIALFLIFGGAMLFIARGLSAGSTGVLTPFLLAQILGLTVGIPLLSAPEGVSAVGALITAACVAGAVAWLVLLRRSLRAPGPDVEQQPGRTGGPSAA